MDPRGRPDEERAAADVITNMTAGGRRQRLVMGIVALIVAAGLGAALWTGGAPRAWRLALLIPLWVAGLGFFQAREGT
jgi:hypothetical protein